MALTKQDTNIQAIVREYVNAGLIDQIHDVASLALKRVLAKTESIADEEISYLLGIGSITKRVRAVRSSMNTTYTTTATGTLATQAKAGKINYYWPLYLYKDDIRYANTPNKLIDYVLGQTEKAANSIREDMQTDIWTAQSTPTTNEDTLLSLVDAIDGNATTTYLNVAEADLTDWSAFTMEAAHTTGTDTGVACSCANVLKMLLAMQSKNGKLPQEIYAPLDVFTLLAFEFDSKKNQIAGVWRDYNAAMGVATLNFLGVPMFVDDNVAHTAFAGSASTRATQYGSSIYFVDWDSFHFPVTPGMGFSANEWMEVADDRTAWMAQVEFQGNLHCERRRSNGVIFNVDTSIRDLDPTTPAATIAVYHAGAVVSAATAAVT
ncbi:MAG TPA: hypothetical protein VM223_25325 [Planctomycetota bacterium]|nr:hypothetical protein [Planctomycetota bacterium]